MRKVSWEPLLDLSLIHLLTSLTLPHFDKGKIPQKMARFRHGLAVNYNISKDSYLGTEVLLTLPPIDHITNKVKQFEKGSVLCKIDFSRAFRHAKINPRNYFLLGLRHKNYYFNTLLPLGYRHQSIIFTSLNNAVRFIMKNKGCAVINALMTS